MKVISAFFITIAFCMFFSCSAGGNSSTSEKGHKVLIVYLSCTNNTKAVAEMIHKKVVEGLVALELVTPYPENFQATVQQVINENERG